MKPIFRSAMFGFHKGDVFNFITRQNKQYESKISELNLELEKAKDEFEQERQAFDRDTTELETLRATTEKMKQTIFALTASVNEILNDKSKLLACAGLLQNEQVELEAKLSEMQLRVNEAEKLRGKAEKFDQLSGVLSSIFNQQEIASQEEVTQTEKEEILTMNVQAVSDLMDLLEVLSVHCEKMQKMLEREQTDD